jgi:hypothetical protein
VFTVLSVLSLLLCLATLALWMRSYSRGDGIDSKCTKLYLASTRGQLHFVWQRDLTFTLIEEGCLHHWSFNPAVGQVRPVVSLLGFSVIDGGRWVDCTIPYWFFAVVYAILPILRLLKEGRQRSNTGLCPVCGYDLRATPDRCPECGTESGSQGSEIRCQTTEVRSENFSTNR